MTGQVQGQLLNMFGGTSTLVKDRFINTCEEGT